MQSRCEVEGCKATGVHLNRCWGHLSDEDFAVALRDLGDGPILGQHCRLSGDRVTEFGRVRGGMNLAFAKIAGDVSFSGITLRSGVRLHGAQFDGQLLIKSVSRLERLEFGVASGRRATEIEKLNIRECRGDDERLNIVGVDVGTLSCERSDLRYVDIHNSRIRDELLVEDVDVRTFTLTRCGIKAMQLRRLRTADGLTINPLYGTELELQDCSLGSWADFFTTSAFRTRRCSFSGPVRLQWRSGAELAAELATDDPARDTPQNRYGVYSASTQDIPVPPEEEAELALRSARFESTASLRWGGAQVDLRNAQFGAASTLDRAAEATARPVLRRVDNLDGRELRLASVDISPTRLSTATSLGPIDVDQLRFGCGAAGITRRRYIADEVADGKPQSKDKARLLARIYRELRTSAEAVGNFSSANDLHYGERLWQRRGSPRPSAEWSWLTAYALVGYGVRPWRPLAGLLGLVVVTALALGLVNGLETTRVVAGSDKDSIASLCERGEEPVLPEQRQTVICPAAFGERLEFSARSATALIRPAAGYNVTGAGVAIDVFSRLAAALLFGLFVLAMRNRIRR